jgi:CBS domain-containing protein
MLQIDPHSAINLDKVSASEYRPTALLPGSLQETSKQRHASAAKGVGSILIESVLPKAHDRLVTIGMDAPLTEAAEFLFDPGCRMVVVCDPVGTMVGVITRTDIIRQIRQCQGCSCAMRCATIMTRHVICCRPDDCLDDVWAVMKERQLHSVPVVDSMRRPIGLLSAREALEALLTAVEYEEGLLKDYVMAVGYR